MSPIEQNHVPRILVFAGPNGAGKSTITAQIPRQGVYVNADEIKRLNGGTDLHAAQTAEKTREFLLAKGMDFTFETVLSTERNLDLLRRAKEAGYEIHAVFVLTKHWQINVDRVKARQANGGHDVPEEKIISRYEKSLQNLKKLARIANRTRVVDNTGSQPELLCEVIGGSVIVSEGTHWKKEEILLLFQ